MDLSSLAPSVRHYFQQGLAQSTRNTYKAALKRFHAFCVEFNVYTPFPVTEELLCCFVVYLANQGLAPQTGKTYLAAIRSMQISLGLPEPRDSSSLPRLKRVLAGIQRVRLRQGIEPKVRLPITASLLSRIQVALAASSDPERNTVWAIASLAFFGFFRLGELLPQSQEQIHPSTCLSWGDVTFNRTTDPSMVKVHLKQSKCDQFGAGVDIIVGRTNGPLCPITAILTYIARRQDQPGPFFLDSNLRPVTKKWFIGKIRALLESLGLPQSQYAGHSFRIGAATTAALAGVEDSTIQILGRWQSSAFLQYVRMPREQLAHLSKQLAVAGQQP